MRVDEGEVDEPEDHLGRDGASGFEIKPGLGREVHRGREKGGSLLAV
jgi:hypothetical protein